MEAWEKKQLKGGASSGAKGKVMGKNKRKGNEEEIFQKEIVILIVYYYFLF